jgi:hypothetical protein
MLLIVGVVPGDGQPGGVVALVDARAAGGRPDVAADRSVVEDAAVPRPSAKPPTPTTATTRATRAVLRPRWPRSWLDERTTERVGDASDMTARMAGAV